MRIMGNDVSMPESPQAKFWTWVVGLVVASIGGWIFMENFFLLRAEGAEMKRDYTAQIAAATSAQAADSRETRLAIEYSQDTIAKRQIDTELFRLRQIPERSLSPQDRAVKARLESDRDDLVKLWISRSRPLR